MNLPGICFQPPLGRGTFKIAAALMCVGLVGTAQAAAVATFDDLPTPPATNSSGGLFFANNGSLVYKGVTWSGVSVVGDAYRVDPGTPGPLFGLPTSRHYAITNQDGASGLTLTTAQVLTGAWFGRNQYYGFTEGGADQVSIFALSGATELGAVVFDLPEAHPGLPEPLSFVDTSVFATYSGITGYRIDRRELGQQNGHWVADDFAFTDARQTVPEPGSLALAGLALVLLRRKPALPPGG